MHEIEEMANQLDDSGQVTQAILLLLDEAIEQAVSYFKVAVFGLLVIELVQLYG